jgi:hypothetical protein
MSPPGLRMPATKIAIVLVSGSVGRAAVAKQAVRLGRCIGGIHAGLVVEGLVTLPDLHREAARVRVAHGYAANVVSGPDCEN